MKPVHEMFQGLEYFEGMSVNIWMRNHHQIRDHARSPQSETYFLLLLIGINVKVRKVRSWAFYSTYLCMRRASVATPESRVAACVLKAKTGLVSLGHFVSSDCVEQVVVTESVHAVVVSASAEEHWGSKDYYFWCVFMFYQRKWSFVILMMWVNPLVTAVPVPIISRLDREEVTGALVLYCLGEPQ